ncbi:MAG: DegV family protein [Chloroflexota bacterium]|nr:DegV family protein [Chloroflexota bacterium]
MSNHKIAVVTDSTAYIPEEALDDLNIPIIPLWVIWGDERFRDGVDIDPPTFYRRLREAKTLPTTSQPSAGEFIDFFRRVAAENDTDTIVGTYISSGLSGTVASAEAAKAQLPKLNITIIDSLFTSMGQGFVALAAARVAAAGGSLEEVIATAEKTQSRSHVLFAVDTLEYLHRGGRIGGAQRFLGTALRIKPLLHLEGGHIEPLAQPRTKRKAIAQMLDVAEERLGGRPVAEASVFDADSPDERDAVAEQIKERFGISTVYRTMVSPVIGTHTGPGSVGVAFYPAASD